MEEKERLEESANFWKFIRIPTQVMTLVGAIIAAMFAVATYEGVASPNDRFLRIEKRQDKVEDNLASMNNSLSRIEGKLNYVLKDAKNGNE